MTPNSRLSDPERAGEASLLGRATFAVVRLAGDLLILTLWTFLLTLVFLATGWPRWGFYLVLLAGAVTYVLVTPPWIRASGS